MMEIIQGLPDNVVGVNLGVGTKKLEGCVF